MIVRGAAAPSRVALAVMVIPGIVGAVRAARSASEIEPSDMASSSCAMTASAPASAAYVVREPR